MESDSSHENEFNLKAKDVIKEHLIVEAVHIRSALSVVMKQLSEMIARQRGEDKEKVTEEFNEIYIKEVKQVFEEIDEAMERLNITQIAGK